MEKGRGDEKEDGGEMRREGGMRREVGCGEMEGGMKVGQRDKMEERRSLWRSREADGVFE